MRLSPNARRFVYVAGLGQRPAAPMVTVIDEQGAAHQIEPGHHVGWSLPDRVIWSPQTDGQVRFSEPPWGGAVDLAMVAGNSVVAAANVVAVYRTDPRRVLVYLPMQWHAPRVIPGAMDPAISDDGRWLAYVLADTDTQGNPRAGASTVFVERSDGSSLRRALGEPGGPQHLRFGGTTLAWEVGRGLIAACADVSNPAVPATHFALPSAWKIYQPVPVWVPTRGELLILFVADDGANGHLKLATWTSLRLGDPLGYDLGLSTGSGYDHDARPVDLDGLRVQWLDPLGVPDGLTKTLTEQRVTLAPPEPIVVETDPLPQFPPNDDEWPRVPDGTPVTDALRLINGTHPLLDPAGSGIICRHKNVNDLEWVRVTGAMLRLWCDRSRFPGDPGWWVEPAPIWAVDHFTSGLRWTAPAGSQIIDLVPGKAPGPWVQTTTLYGLQNGGAEIQFDPRHPQDWGPSKMYERHSHTPSLKAGEPGRFRFEEWYSPGPGQADVLKRRLTVWSDIDRPPDPRGYVAPPRPLMPVVEPPKEPNPMPDTKPDFRGIPRDQLVLGLEAIHGYLVANGERLGAPEGFLPSTGTFAERMDKLVAYGLSEFGGAFQAGGPLPGDAAGYDARRQRAQDHAVAVIEREWRRQQGGGGGPISGPGPHRVLEGQVRLVDGAWHDDRGAFLPLLVHWGESFGCYMRGRPDDVKRQAEVCFAEGYPVAQTWTTLGWEGRSHGPRVQGRAAWREALVEYLRMKRAIGLQTFLCGGGWVDTVPEYVDDLADVLLAVGPGVVTACEMNNESWQNGADSRTLRDAARRLKQRVPWMLVALSSPPPEPSRAVIRDWSDGADFATMHSIRWQNMAFKLRRMWNEVYEAGTYHETRRVPAQWNNEGPGPQPPGNPDHPYRPGSPYVTSQDNSHELDDDGMMLIAGGTYAAGMGYGYFSGYGAYWDGPLESQAGFRMSPELVRHLPPSLLQAGSKLVHGGEGQPRVFAVAGREDRSDHIIAPDGHFLVVCSGPTWRDSAPVRGFTELWRYEGQRGRLVVGRV